MRDARTSCALTSLRSVYADLLNASLPAFLIGIYEILTVIVMHALIVCVQTRAYAHWLCQLASEGFSSRLFG